MDDLMQPDWPLRFDTLPDGTVQFAEAVQDSDRDRLARAAVVISIPKGSLDFEPAVGITPLPFQTGAVNTARLVSEINQTDPTIQVEADEVMDAVDHTYRTVTVHVTDAS